MDPVTMMAIGAVAGAGESFLNARQASSVAKYNAAVATRNAEQERVWAAAQSRSAQREARLRQGRARTAAGASGVALGSFDDIFSDDAIQEEMEALNIRLRGETAAQAYLGQAAGYRMEARSARATMPFSVLGGAMRGAGGMGTLVSRFGG